MSAPEKETKLDFDEEFLQTLEQWREKNKIRDDDAVYLLVELFRIHQNHWDELRRRQMPSLDQFRADASAVTESASLSRKSWRSWLKPWRCIRRPPPSEQFPGRRQYLPLRPPFSEVCFSVCSLENSCHET
jgi:hypothetical protein